MIPNEFTCDECGDTYKTGRDDDEARNEAKENFGGDFFERTEIAIVCDDCYQGIMKRAGNEEV